MRKALALFVIVGSVFAVYGCKGDGISSDQQKAKQDALKKADEKAGNAQQSRPDN